MRSRSQKNVFQKDSGKRDKRKKIALIGLFFIFSFSIVVYRCIHLQIASDPKIEKIAKSQYTKKIEEASPRGNIYDANGDELAISVPSYSVAVRPGKIKNKEETFAALASILGLKKEVVVEKLDPSKKYVWLKKAIAPQEKEKIEEKKIEGVELVKGSKRFYPNREVASQILGAVSLENQGLGGVELFYDRYLKGSEAATEAYRDARGKTFVTEENVQEKKDEIHHLTLTLRKNIQYVTEKELNKACDTYHARACTAIVIEPQTGAILSMASYPNFNPNSYQSYSLSTWRNLAVTDTFEPGSTFKTIMAAAALESGAAKPADKFFCENGALTIGKHTIHDHEHYGMLSLSDILKVSSNVGIYKVGRKVGKKAFSDIVKDFGFGKKLAIDYPGESSGYFKNSSSWQEIEFANISFGQGLTVTPLQIASSFATIANGGVRMRPYFVSRVTDAQNKAVLEVQPQEIGRVLSEKNSKLLIEMLKEVTREGGTATRAAIPGYSVAGKTGTAQKVVGKTYSHTKFMSSFVGMVPANNPKMVVLVTIDEPQGVVYGGLVATPVFRDIAWAALRDLAIPPEEDINLHETPKVPDSKPLPKSALPKVETAKKPEKKEPVFAEASFLKTSDLGLLEEDSENQENVMPSFVGLSKRKVLSILEEKQLQGKIVGSGVAVSQEPAAGHVLKKGQVCRVVFSTE